MRFLPTFTCGLLLAAGCYEHHRLGSDASVDVRTDPVVDVRPDVPVDMRPPDPTCPPEVDPLDILFVVDNSNSMSQEQVSFTSGLGGLFAEFAAEGLDVRVGTVSTDMGTGGFSVFTCNEPNFGDDGILRAQGNTALAGCASVYPDFVAFGEGTTSDEEAALAARCVALMGTQGCGFEQQLDAALKALSSSRDPFTFASRTTGHGDGANRGFLRPEAALAIVLLTDEDDCSASDPDVFNIDSSRYPGPDLNLRCFQYPEAVHEVRRYIEGFSGLKPDPRRISFVAIAGTPTDLEGRPYDAILADERMLERIDPSMPSQLRPSCDTPGRGLAFPPRRIVQAAAGLDERGVQTRVFSICREFPLSEVRETIFRSTGRCAPL